MASNIILKIRSDKTQSQLEGELLTASGGSRYVQAEKVSDFLSGLKGGAKRAVLEIPVDSTAATGLFTVASSGAQTVTIEGVTLTGGTDYTIANQTVAQVVANLAEAINDSDLNQLVEASVYSATEVFVEAKWPGVLGNEIDTSASGAVSAGAAALAGGASGELRVFEFNLTL